MVEEPNVRLLDGVDSVYSLAGRALDSGEPLTAIVQKLAGGSAVSYDEIYEGRAAWHILPPIDHPHEPTRCLITGTGLTHLKSAENRQAMHAATATVTDSMRMYEWGVQGGRPPAGQIGVSPEWFYKGSGAILRAHGEPLLVPPHAQDGGEEAEIAGIYIVGRDGTPRRIGMTAGNEFSDHIWEEKNYLYLAASKLMTCALGPELIVDPDFRSVEGEVRIERLDKVIWRTSIRSGEEVMCHHLANMEHHHFKHPAHRHAGDVHVHFFGADAFSFGDRVTLQDGDVMQIHFSGFGRPLRNPVRVDRSPQTLFAVRPL